MKIELTNIDDTRKPVVNQILEELERKKKAASSSGNEELANNCWRESEALKANIRYIEAFDKIKSKKYRDAWYDLERCEIDADSIERNSDSNFFINSRCHFIKNKYPSGSLFILTVYLPVRVLRSGITHAAYAATR